MSALGNLVVRLALNTVEFTQPLDKAQHQARQAMDKIADSVDSARRSMSQLALAFAAGFSVKALHDVFDSVVKAASGLDDLAEATGSTVEELSSLTGVAKLADTSMETIGGALQKLSKGLVNADEETKGAGAALAALGLSAKDSAGALKSPAEMMKEVAGRLAEYRDGAAKTAIVQDLFGKSGAQLLPFLKDLSDAGTLNAKITSEQAAQAEAYEKAMKRLSSAGDAWKKTLAVEVIPAASAFVTVLADMAVESNRANDAARKLAKDGSVKSWADQSALALAALMDQFTEYRDVLVLGVAKIKQAWDAAAVGLSKAVTGSYDKEALQIYMESQRTVALIEKDNATKRYDQMQQRLRIAQIVRDAEAGMYDDMRDRMARGEKQALNYHNAGKNGAKEHKDALTELDKALVDINKKMNPDYDEMRLFALLHVAVATGKISIQEYAEKLAFLTGQLSFVKRAHDEMVASLNASRAAQVAAIDEIVKGADSIDKQAAALEEQNRVTGIAKSTLEELTIARLEDRKAELEAVEGNDEAVAALYREIEARRRLRDAMRNSEALQAERDEQRQSLDAFRSGWEAVDRTAHDVFVNIFQGGKSAFEKLRDTLKATLLDLLYQMTVKQWVFQIYAAVSGGSSGSTGGWINTVASLFGGGGGGTSGGGITGTLSSIVSLGRSAYQAWGWLTGSSAGASSAGYASTLAAASEGGYGVSSFASSFGNAAGTAGTTGASFAQFTPYLQAAAYAAVYAAIGNYVGGRGARALGAGEEGQQAGANWGMGLAMVGAAIAGPIGAAIGAVLGALVGKFTDPDGLATRTARFQTNAAGDQSGLHGGFGIETSRFGTFGIGLGDKWFSESDMGQALKAYFAAFKEVDNAFAGMLSEAQINKVKERLQALNSVVYNWGTEHGPIDEGIVAVMKDRYGTVLQELNTNFADKIRQFQGTGADLLAIIGTLASIDLTKIPEELRLNLEKLPAFTKDAVQAVVGAYNIKEATVRQFGEFPKVLKEILDAAMKDVRLTEEEVKEYGQMATALAVLTNTLPGLNDQLRNLSAQSLKDLVHAAGGVDKLTQSLAQYTQLFVPQSQQLEMGIKGLSDKFASLGLKLPTTNEGMVALVNSIDVTTESGRNALLQVLALAPDVAAFINNIQGLRAGLKDLIGQFMTEEERLAIGQQEINTTFARLGIAVPQSNEQFRRLLETIDVTTPAGRAMYDALKGVAPAFLAIQSAADQARQNLAALGGQLRNLALGGDYAPGFRDRASNPFRPTNTDPAPQTTQAIQQYNNAVVDSGNAAADAARKLEEAERRKQSLWERYATDAEKLAKSQADLLIGFSRLGIAVPQSAEQFAALVKGIDPTTAAGAALLEALEKLAPAFDAVQAAAGKALDEALAAMQRTAQLIADVQQFRGQVQGAALQMRMQMSTFDAAGYWRSQIGRFREQMSGATDTAGRIAAGQGLQNSIQQYAQSQIAAAGRIRDQRLADLQTEYTRQQELHRTQIDSVKQLADAFKGLGEYAKSLLTSDLSPLTSRQKLDEAGKQFRDLLSRARGGDADAARQLQGAAQTYLQQGRQYYASSDAYTSIFSEVQGALSGLGGAAGELLSRYETETLTLQREDKEFSRQRAAIEDEYNRQVLGYQEQAVRELEELARATEAWETELRADLRRQANAIVNSDATLTQILGAVGRLSGDIAGAVAQAVRDALAAGGGKPTLGGALKDPNYREDSGTGTGTSLWARPTMTPKDLQAIGEAAGKAAAREVAMVAEVRAEQRG